MASQQYPNPNFDKFTVKNVRENKLFEFGASLRANFSKSGFEVNDSTPT